ncbi:Oxidoreductase, partial [Lachnellula willkommii]
MVALDIVHASNTRLRELGPGLVALFVGGTSGIGEFTLKAFVQNTISPKVYIVGRSAPAAERIIEECKAINKDGKVEFLQANVTELAEVDRVCKEIEKKETKINLIVQTQGNLTLAGRLESPEGIDRKFTLNFYSRMRFIQNLRPLLKTATTTAPHFSRTLSVLSAGHGEGKLDFNDLELKNNYSGTRCATHTITMNSIMVEEFAARDQGTTFAHSYPSVVNTGIARELPVWARASLTLFKPLLLPFMVSVEETGARQLFIATSGLYPPAKPAGDLASGVPAPKGLETMNGADGQVGSGGYLVNWNDDIARSKILKEYRDKGVGKTVWEHTMGIFERVEKVNKARSEVGSKGFKCYGIHLLFTMAPYASQLEYIRQRALLESDLKLAENLTTFYAAYAAIVTQTCKKYRLDSTEVQQYEAEKRLFKIIWPNEFFPGQPPYRKYILQLRNIQQRALDAGVPPEAFDQVCKRLALARYEDEEEDFDLKQYRTEKLLWGHF